MDDTPRDILLKQFEIINAMPLSKRLELAFDLTELSREIIRNRLREKNPGISEIDLKVELFKIFYKPDFSKKKLNEIADKMRECLLKNEEKE